MASRPADYFVFPSVVPANKPSTIHILPSGDHAAFEDGVPYTIELIPMECFNVPYCLDRFSAEYETRTAVAHNGALCFTYTFLGEQEWSVAVFPAKDPERRKLFHIFAAEEDLYRRTPYRGDLHTHSNRSDGSEAPAVVAANYRKAGFDFLAITDHHRYRPSLEAIEAFRGVTTGLRLFPGEEVHVPGNYVHMVNFGGSLSVNELFEADPDKCWKEVEQLAGELTVPGDINPMEYAWRVWVVSHIRQGGGLAILAHPFWTWCDEYNMQTKLTQYLLRTGCYDAFELLGGLEDRENNLQVALYGDARAEGCKIPIVGSSDSHGTQPPIYFGSNCTVLLADGELDQNTLSRSILEHYSVAVGMRDWKPVRVYGTFRMVKYVQFLLEHYFPRHDELCVEEGILMLDYACGDKAAKERLAGLSSRIEAFRDRFFGRNGDEITAKLGH